MATRSCLKAMLRVAGLRAIDETSNHEGFVCRKQLTLNLYENFATPNFTFPHFGTFALAAAGAVFDADVPAMPAADHLAGLHDAFAQGKSEVWTEVLDGVDVVVPPE